MRSDFPTHSPANWLVLAALVLAPHAIAAQAEVPDHRHEVRPIAAVDEVWIEDMTWMEVRDAIDGGASIAIIPTGGIEQNGPYLTTGKHNVIMTGACETIARKLGNALCAPVVGFVPEGDIDPPTSHMLFPGTISLTQETYRALLEDIGASLLVHGFTDVIFIGDSGGNQAGMRDVAEILTERWAHRGGRAHYVEEFYRPGYNEADRFVAEELGLVETHRDGYHDDPTVTLLMMAVDPLTVRHPQRVEAGLASINGVDLTPLEERIEDGRRLNEFRADLTVDAIRRAVAAPFPQDR
jgi:creatinine amidohydrolase